MSFDDYLEDVYTVPSAAPDNAFLDPRARQLWSLARDNVKIPSPTTFFFNFMSVVAMAGATTLGRVMLAFHNVTVHNVCVSCFTFQLELIVRDCLTHISW